MPESNIPIIIDDFRQIYAETESKENELVRFSLPRCYRICGATAANILKKNCAGAMCPAQFQLSGISLYSFPPPRALYKVTM